MAIRNSVNKPLFTLPFLRESSPAEDEETVVTTGQVAEEPMIRLATKTPTEVERMRTRQAQEKIALQQRQANELMAAKLRDVQQKSRKQQMKTTAPKSAAKPART